MATGVEAAETFAGSYIAIMFADSCDFVYPHKRKHEPATAVKGLERCKGHVGNNIAVLVDIDNRACKNSGLYLLDMVQEIYELVLWRTTALRLGKPADFLSSSQLPVIEGVSVGQFKTKPRVNSGIWKSHGYNTIVRSEKELPVVISGNQPGHVVGVDIYTDQMNGAGGEMPVCAVKQVCCLPPVERRYLVADIDDLCRR